MKQMTSPIFLPNGDYEKPTFLGNIWIIIAWQDLLVFKLRNSVHKKLKNLGDIVWIIIIWERDKP